MFTCQECNARVSDDGVGHRAECSKCTDDASFATAQAWIESRPPAVREAIIKYPPDRLYKMKTTGQLVFIYCYSSNDDDTVCEHCTVSVTHKYNPECLVERNVFNVPLADLEDTGRGA